MKTLTPLHQSIKILNDSLTARSRHLTQQYKRYTFVTEDVTYTIVAKSLKEAKERAKEYK